MTEIIQSIGPEHTRGAITANYTDQMRDTMLKDFYTLQK